jgi:hypothetical protein
MLFCTSSSCSGTSHANSTCSTEQYRAETVNGHDGNARTDVNTGHARIIVGSDTSATIEIDYNRNGRSCLVETIEQQLTKAIV